MERIRRPRGSGHAHYRGPKSATGILIAIFAILASVILAAILFAPRKPPPPPASAISYEGRPKQAASADADDDDPVRFARGKRNRVKETPQPPQESVGRYKIFGSVKEIKTGKAVPNATVSCAPLGVLREIDALKKGTWDDEAEKKHEALLEEQRKSSAHAETDKDGNYVMRVEASGEYALDVRASGYIAVTNERGTIDEAQGELRMDFTLSTGASISGRITESGTQKGAKGVTVGAEGPQPYRGEVQSDENGRYTVSGLGPGDFAVTLFMRNCPYIVTGMIPSKNVTIKTETQEVTGIDFVVDAAGEVWGYVMTREGTAVRGTDVVLCTSASVFSQVSEAAIKQAPPLGGGSDEEGYYEIMGVPLNKEWKLYAMTKERAPQLTAPFILTPSQRTARIDIYVSPGTNVYGRVVDTSRTAIAQADVICIPAYSKFFSPLDAPQAFRNQKSKEDGSFQIPQLPVGEYQILAQKHGYKFAATGEPIYPDGYTDIRNVEVVLTPVESGQFTVYGTVTDASGNPIKDVKLSLGSLSGSDFSAEESTATTDAGGNYTFNGVQSGFLMLRTEKPGYQGQDVTNVKLDEPTDIVMEAGATLRGTVLVKETNSPPPNAQVSAMRVAGQEGGRGGLGFLAERNFESTSTDASGNFVLEVGAGSYMIEARAPGLTSGRTQVAVEAGQNREGVVVYVRKAGGHIAGRVTVSAGKSPAGALVWMSQDASADMSFLPDFGAMSQQRGIQVGADGLFEFRNLPAGTYIIRARMEGYAQGQSAPVELGDGQTVSGVEITLGTGGTLQGYVFVNGSPEAGAIVTVIGEGLSREPASADESGFYQIDQLPAGSHLATAVAMPRGGNIISLLSPMSARVQIVEGQTTTHNFGEPSNTALVGHCTPVPSAGTMAIAVLLPPGTTPDVIPQMGVMALISWFASNIDKFMGTSAIQGGDFRIDSLVAGEYPLVVVLGNAVDALTGGGSARIGFTGMVTIVDGQVTELDIPISGG